VKSKLSFIVLVSVPILLGLRDVDFKGYTDPDFLDYKADSFAVCYTNATNSFQMPFEKEFFKLVKKNKMAGQRCDDVFPPTRDWTLESRLDLMVKLNIDAILLVDVGLESGDRLFKQDEFSAELIDAISNRKVWVGKAGINSSGTLFTKTKGVAKLLAKLIFKDLSSKGLTE